MYPTISYLIHSLTGLNLPIPGNTFGLFVALAFMAAYRVLRYEMNRREKAGEFRMDKVQVLISAPMKIQEVITTTLLWGLMGWKFGYGVLNWEAFSSDTAGVILSWEGNWLIGLGAAALAFYLKFREFQKRKDNPAEYEEQILGPSRHLGKILTMAFIGGILGAKIFAFLEDLPGFIEDPLGAIFSLNGLTFYGGLLTAAFVIIRFLKRNGYKPLHMIDVFVPCLILAYGVGRIGCHMSGDGDWGIENMRPKPAVLAFLPDGLWSSKYPHNVNNEGVLIADCQGKFCHELKNPVYPTPIYETFMALAIFALLWGIRKKLFIHGQLTGIYLFFNGLERFLIEQIRVNSTYDFGGFKVTQAEIIATSFMVLGIGILLWVSLRKNKEKVSDPIK